MDNPIYIALSRQMILRRQMDVVANNIANADTVGFKVEELIVKPEAQTLPGADGGQDQIVFPVDTALARDFGQGALAQTGSALDVAIEGDGFFKVSTPNGERYTRDGRFTLDASGKLTTKTGAAVQGDGGDIVIDTKKGPITIAQDGVISQGPERVGRLSAVSFSDKSGLTKEGDGLYSNRANTSAQPAQGVSLHQSMVENSNVNSILQITNMIEVSRAYERMSKIVDETAELDLRAIQMLGKAA
jgi:flagellar basal-body rod protein FlgF